MPNSLRFERFLLLLIVLHVVSTASLFAANNKLSDDSAASAKASRAAFTFEAHVFEAKSGESVDAEIGYLSVPENRQDPSSRLLRLAMVRFAATGPKPGPPIIYLSGGPGGSGITTAQYGRFPLFMALREFGDVIALDQRGTGLSNDIPACDADQPWPDDRPVTRDHLEPWFTQLATRCAAQWSTQDVDLRGYSTAESAADLDDLRRALGVPKVRLWAISYGTHLAFAALRDYGEGIDRVILASAEGPDDTIKLPSRTQDFLERVDSLWHGQTGAEPCMLDALARVLAKLRAEPIRVETADPRSGKKLALTLGAFEVQMLFGYLVKNPATLVDIPQLVFAMDSGDFSTVALYATQVRSALQRFSAMSAAMDAVSGISPQRAERVARERQWAIMGDALNYPGPALTEALGLKAMPERYRAVLQSPVPALFLSGSLDGRTYPESHRELAAGFPNAVHVIVENAGHDLFLASPEVLERMREFLAGGATSDAPIVAEPPLFKTLE